MKCHCYETDPAFVFCVEDIENAQLEYVVQHMAWKKTTVNFLCHFHRTHFQISAKKSLSVAISAVWDKRCLNRRCRVLIGKSLWRC